MTEPVVPSPVDELPTTPQRLTDTRVQFVANVDGWYAAYPTYRLQMIDLGAKTYQNAVAAKEKADAAAASAVTAQAASAAALEVTGRVVESGSSHSLTVGEKTFATTGAAFVEDEIVAAIRLSAPSDRMWGAVQPGSTASSVVLDIASTDDIAGSGGPYTDWVLVSALYQAEGATVAEVIAGVSRLVAIPPAALAEAVNPVAVAFAAPLTLDFGAGINFDVGPITSNFQLANPTGITEEMIGRSGRITLPLDATGTWLISYGTYWKPAGAHQALPSGASKSSTLYYDIKSLTRIEYNLVRDYLA